MATTESVRTPKDPLARIRADASPFPTEILEGCESALVLFAAAFMGRNDAIHIHDAGLWASCVDTDEAKLRRMDSLYPANWEFVVGDAWEVAEHCVEAREKFDVVTVDTFTGGTMHRALADLPLWCALARKAVLVTVTPRGMNDVQIPRGWWARMFERSANAHWLVLLRT